MYILFERNIFYTNEFDTNKYCRVFLYIDMQYQYLARLDISICGREVYLQHLCLYRESQV